MTACFQPKVIESYKNKREKVFHDQPVKRVHFVNETKQAAGHEATSFSASKFFLIG
jgi:hypothetical protein